MTVAADIARLRDDVTRANLDLVRNGLVVWTGGNASARVPGADLMLIKPSGIDYDDLTPESIVLCDLHGNVVEGDLAPSSDTASHCYIYRHLPSVGGVTHTHSTYACAWAARGEPVPCVLTAMADEFGGDIPCAPFVLIGTEAIGEVVVRALRTSASSAVLVQNHGPFTVGATVRAAVKSAVMCEDVCRTVHIAYQIGEPLAIAPEHIRSLHDRYQNVYGQHPTQET
jgi:L-ribulose-5-phosphate 4-epimerase